MYKTSKFNNSIPTQEVPKSESYIHDNVPHLSGQPLFQTLIKLFLQTGSFSVGIFLHTGGQHQVHELQTNDNHTHLAQYIYLFI